ncbi:uncharacterized protein [Nicotiana tomentosiformis]|uniref:uncharacterized protein n=1 Tax=Nicotiana tomentosiformis TaxID=4098 RepID=UPI00388C385A
MSRFVRVKTSDLIPVDDMPFPEKWNMNLVARMPEPIPGLKQWVEGLVLQRPYSERAWVELSKGLGKDVSMRPPSSDEEVPTPKQVKEKKIKDASSSLVSEKKNRQRNLTSPRRALEHGAGVRNLTEKCDSNKLLSEKLRADLATARDEHEEMAEQVDELLAEVEKFKENMDVLASKKEAVQAQLELAETQLRVVEENASVQIEKIKELQHRLDLATSDKACLADELELARSEVAEANKRVDAKVAQFRIDV